jgi:phosphate-selective porin OprO/OprP
VALLSAAPAAAHAQSATETPAPQPARRFVWEDHPTFRFGGPVQLQLRLRVQNDIRETDGPLPSGEDGFKVPLKRAGVRGAIGRSIDFQVDRELVRDDGWRDVFVNLRWRPALNLRAGQFKLPFSLEETTGLTVLDFMYRARAARQLAPGRDPGAMAYGELSDGAVRYEAGVFRKDGRNARRTDSDRVQGGRTLAARIRVQPLAGASPAWRTLDVGIAVMHSTLRPGVPALRARTALDATFFSPDDPVAGDRDRLGLELAWQPGPFGVKSEYIRLTDERPDTAPTRAPLVASGWYASAMCVLTGEQKVAGLSTPARPVHRGGLGSIEIAGRVDALRFRDGDRLQSAVRAATVGVNWQLNRWIRAQFNLIRERLENPSTAPPTRPLHWHRVFRIQIVI